MVIICNELYKKKYYYFSSKQKGVLIAPPASLHGQDSARHKFASRVWVLMIATFKVCRICVVRRRPLSAKVILFSCGDAKNKPENMSSHCTLSLTSMHKAFRTEQLCGCTGKNIWTYLPMLYLVTSTLSKLAFLYIFFRLQFEWLRKRSIEFEKRTD